MRETDIRPDNLRAGQAEALQADVAWLLDRLDEFVSADCPACDTERGFLAFEKRGFVYRSCRKCGTLFMSPRPSPSLLAEFYVQSRNYAYWNEHIFPASERVRRPQIFRPRAHRLARLVGRYKVATNMLVEVGAGFGTFCQEIAKLGLFRTIVAVEPVPDLAQTCRAKDIRVIEAPIERASIARGTVDVVASFETIEHLFSPRQFVEQCAGLLAPGGMLVLTCPNIRGFDTLVLGAQSDVIDHEHLNYFHPDSLSALVQGHGLWVEEVLTPGELDAEIVRKNIDLVDPGPFLRQLLNDDWERAGEAFQRFLAENRLSSHMWLVARKV